LGESHVNAEHLDALLHRIRKIKDDKITSKAVESSKSLEDANDNYSTEPDVYDFDENDELNVLQETQNSGQKKRKV
jgi:hypothetical protein